MHWFDELVRRVEAFLSSKEEVVCNAGLSVSGLQHVGRLRGEIVLNHFLATHLRAVGKAVKQHLVLYTQDRWKGSPGQLAQFPGGEGEAYVGRRLIDVPDPEGCHENWVDHFWRDFSNSLDSFAPGVHITTTTDIYRRDDMQRLVLELIERREEVRQVVNRYRPRNPYPLGWLPFEPLCNACQRIGDARAVEVKDGQVAYECSCGDEGVSAIHLGKLNWRLEWPALWKILEVDVEPFGKDHAAPGGSRESCQVIAETIMGIRPPFGIPYEWVGYGESGQDLGDMDSSDFKGFGPGEWLGVADPEVLRFLFANAPVRRRILLDLSKVDSYHQLYDQAEEAYYDGRRDEVARAYELAQLRPLPSMKPYQLPYRHAALLSQVAPEEEILEWSLQRLRDTGMLTQPLWDDELLRIERRLKQSRVWAQKYAPPEARVELLPQLTEEIRQRLAEEDRKSLEMLALALAEAAWTADGIKEAMVKLTRSGKLPVPTKRFFASLYTVLLGKPSGPRAAPLLSVLDRDFVMRRLQDATHP